MSIGNLAVKREDGEESLDNSNMESKEPGVFATHYQFFQERHIGPSEEDIQCMLNELSFESLDAFTEKVLPSTIQLKKPLRLSCFPEALPEEKVLEELRTLANKNKVYRSFIGMGYYNTITPPVIQRNILENPGWYTQYTPYQAEIAQGRLEALLNFQTLVCELTEMPISNASLLDEGSAAAEACHMSFAQAKEGSSKYFVAKNCHPQTIEVVKTRAKALEVEVVVGDPVAFKFSPDYFGALVQYPASDGEICNYKEFVEEAHKNGALVSVATDLLALTLLAPPGEFGADIALGSAQRFGVPLGFGGPHAAFFATRDELKRLMPGRLVGMSKDADGQPGLRLSLQTREQHIRREKATSNICTAQVLLAVMASMYAVYHGPTGLRRIAKRIQYLTRVLRESLNRRGLEVIHSSFFDTLKVKVEGNKDEILKRAQKQKINLRNYEDGNLGVSLDETTSEKDVKDLIAVFTGQEENNFDEITRVIEGSAVPSSYFTRNKPFLTQKVFTNYHSETEFLRYLKKLESKDLSLGVSMIPLGSCTMKLNATSEMLPVTWDEFSKMHPFSPLDQTKGYQELFKQLETGLREITGFSAVSLQPNSGAQGEYAGLLAIRAYHESCGQGQRRICLIPHSAHGTNPASAMVAGMEVVVVECDSHGNVDVSDLRAKAKEHASNLAALMITYPSTHGVFEEHIKEICKIVHAHGGQVYMDGANLNALVGLSRPSDLGADVCHINLHKTFCIPHGGGGPGMGPIGVKKHLAPFLPNHPLVDLRHEQGVGPVTAAPWGSASILTIPWVYMRAMGGMGLRKASQVAILNANYVARRLEKYYPVLYRGKTGFVAHECILDLRAFKKTTGIEVGDVAKRLMDYGFHAPTVSWPVPGTMIIEPTESESKDELDRFCEAMIYIYQEIKKVEEGVWPNDNNPLKNAPHTARRIAGDWTRPYSREEAAYPAPWCKEFKFWPAVARVDNSYGDRNLVCTCG